MQRKKYNYPKIVLLNVELELKAEKENAELRIENVEVFAQIFMFAFGIIITLSFLHVYRVVSLNKVLMVQFQ